MNTYLKENPEDPYQKMKITRTTPAEKNERLKQLEDFQSRNVDKRDAALERLKETALRAGNIFEELLEAVQYASLGQITKVLYDVGGKYRRGF